MKISYLGAVAIMLAASLQACTVYQPYSQTSTNKAGLPLMTGQERFRLVDGVPLQMNQRVEDPAFFSKGTMPPDTEPFVYLHKYEYLVSKDLDYWQQVKAMKSLAMQYGADAIVDFEVKSATPAGAEYYIADTKLLTGAGIKYLKNIDHVIKPSRTETYYNLKNAEPVVVSTVEWSINKHVQSVTGDAAVRTNLQKKMRDFSPYELIDMASGWKFKKDANGRVVKRKEMPKNGQQGRTCRFIYDDQQRVSQILVQEINTSVPTAVDTVDVMYDEQGRYLSSEIKRRGRSEKIVFEYVDGRFATIDFYDSKHSIEKPAYRLVFSYYDEQSLLEGFAKEGLLVDKRPNTQVPSSPNPTYITSGGPQNPDEPATAPSYIAPAPTELSAGVPRHAAPRPDAVAVVIGNQTYRHKDIPSVSYALNDANMVKKYLVEAYGFREENIIYLENATLSDFNSVFGNEAIHTGKLFSYVKPGQSDVFVYYSGHGAPDLASKQGYFVPADADAGMVGLSGYPVGRMFANLSKIPYKSLTVVLDACFSGASEGGMLIREASPVYLKSSVQVMNDEKSMVFLSSAGDQISSWYGEKQHSLFTYFFLKGLQGSADENGDGTVFLQEMKDYLEKEVVFRARKLHNRQQTPEVYGVPTNILIQQK